MGCYHTIQTDSTQYVRLENFTSTENTVAHQVRVWRSLSELSDSDELLQNGSQLKFVQREHRGGFCDCWAIANLTVNHMKYVMYDVSYNIESSVLWLHSSKSYIILLILTSG